MRLREAHIVGGAVYRLPSGHMVRLPAHAASHDLVCEYAIDRLGALEHTFGQHPAGPLLLSERFIAKHARGPLR